MNCGTRKYHAATVDKTVAKMPGHNPPIRVAMMIAG
jgi:hypothetical protein